MFGTSFGSLIALVLSPVITRLFDPASFGAFTVLTSVAIVLTPILSLRLELAVPLPKHETSAWALLHAGLVASLLNAALLSTLFAAVSHKMLDGAVGDWLWVTPIMAAAMAVFSILNAMAIRHLRYRAIARRNVLMALSSLGFQIAAGLMGYGVGGLVLGFALGQIVGAASLLYGAGLLSPYAREGRHADFILATLNRYRRVPTLLAFAGLINVLGLQAPIFLLARFFDTDVVGWFGLTQRVLAMPMTLVGMAVAQVYLGELAGIRRGATGGESRYFYRASAALLAAGTVCGGIVILLAPPIFGLVFGSDWEQSGHYARALAISIVAQFVASPLSQTLIVYERATLQFGWDCFRLTAVTSAITGPALMGMTAGQTIWILGGISALTYAISWDLSRRTTTVSRRMSAA